MISNTGRTAADDENHNTLAHTVELNETNSLRLHIIGRRKGVWCSVKVKSEQCNTNDDIFDSPLDPGIAPAVKALRRHNVETFESCQGGDGHAYFEPTVRFHGGVSEGPRAFAAALLEGLPVAELRRTWVIHDGELTGPYWEMTFCGKVEK